MPTTILLASSNPHKIQEVRAIIASLQSQSHDTHTITFVGLKDIGLTVPEPDETEPTFEGNAALKARYYATAANMLCIADDSGLEVDALNGAPGVISARYSGATGKRDVVDPSNNKHLLKNLADTPIPKRTARFVCTIAFAGPQGKDAAWYASQGIAKPSFLDEQKQTLILCRGTVEGRILLPSETADPSQPEKGRGENGFGYDPLFYLKLFNKTAAQISPEQKNQISHRGNAVRIFWDRLKPLL
jgi:XTP/dITP diphosphohydrolase